jgi:hypothetical protein
MSYKEFLNEIKRMKSLSKHERGVVVSEQNYIIKEAFDFNKYPCIPKTWERKKAATGTNGPTETGIEFVTAQGQGKVKNPTGDNYFDLKDIRFSEQGEWYFSAYQKGKFSCNGGQILFDGKPMETNKPSDKSTTPAKTTQTPAKTGGKTLYDVVVATEDKCKPGKMYNWKEVRGAYQKEHPEGKEGSMEQNLKLQKDWNGGWRPKCGNDTPVIDAKLKTGTPDEEIGADDTPKKVDTPVNNNVNDLAVKGKSQYSTTIKNQLDNLVKYGIPQETINTIKTTVDRITTR